MSWSPINHVLKQGTSTGSGNSNPVDMTGANLIVANICSQGGSTFTDSNSNTWTQLTGYTAGTIQVQLVYCYNPIVSMAQTFEAHAGIGFSSISVAGFSGAASTPFDVENGNGGGSAGTIQPGSVTPTHPNSLVISAIGDAFSGSVSVDSGFTITDQAALIGGSSFANALAYLVTGSAVNPTWTDASSARKEANIAVFTGVGGAIGVMAFGPPTVGGDALFLTPTGPGVLAFGPLGMGSSAGTDSGTTRPAGVRQFWTL